MNEKKTPYPYRIFEDMGSGFLMGFVGGGLMNFLKGARHAPSGHRMRSGVELARVRGPVVGGNFASWGGVYAIIDLGLVKWRKKEDPWNALIAGSLTGTTLALRSGVRSAVQNGVVGGVLLGAVEAFGMYLQKFIQRRSPMQQTAPKPPNQNSLL
jgi:mitochondrial import inner membrane translocase subunit TIM17